MIPRRGLLAGLGALLAAPAIIRTPGLLMPVRPVGEPVLFGVDWGRSPPQQRIEWLLIQGTIYTRLDRWSDEEMAQMWRVG